MQHAALAREAKQCRVHAGIDQLEQLRPLMEHAIDDLDAACLRLGSPSRRGNNYDGQHMPELCFGGRGMNFQYEQVDAIHRATRLTTTLFVLANQPDGTRAFYRVATNVKRADGERATGTQLNPQGSVARRLLKGEQTYGYVYILGVPHIAAYRPLLDSAGEVVGASYVGRAIKSMEVIAEAPGRANP